MNEDTWKVTIEFNSENYEFFGVYVEEEANVYCFCDHVSLSSRGNSREKALDNLIVMARVLLRTYEAMGQKYLDEAVGRQELWKAK